MELVLTASYVAEKDSLYEGGIKEPFIFWAPGRINFESVGKVNNAALLAGMDLPPSFLAMAGISVPQSIKFDGLNRKDVLFGNSTVARQQAIMWVRPPGGKASAEANDLAIRDGKWKLLTDINGKMTQLYNIDADPKESNNITAQNHQISEKLKTQVLSWFYAIRPHTSSSIKPWQ